MVERHDRVRWGISIAVAVAACLLVRASPDWTADDAYIVARYAQNLARHGSLSWNPSGPPVEGITGLLLTLVESIVFAFGGSGVLAARLLGGAAFVVSAVLVPWIAHELRPSWWFSAASAVVFVFAGEHAPHLRSGLETEIYVAANLAGALCLVRDARRGRACSAALLATCNVLALTRPEGAVVAACLLGASLWLARPTRPAVLRGVVGFLGPMGAVTAARWLHFGSLLPNTFYAKRGAANAEFLRDVWAMTSDSCLDLALLGVLAAVVLVTRRGRFAVTRPERALLAIGVTVVGASALAYGRSDLVMNYGRRFAVHVFPWVVTSTLVLATHVVDALRSRDLGRMRVLVGAFALLALAHGVFVSFEARSAASTTAIMRGRLTAPMYDAARDWIVDHAPPTATLACYPDAGRIPFETGLRSIDFGKLNDAYLARTAKSPADVADYFFRSMPDLLLLWKREGGLPYDEGAGAILADERFARYRVGFAREQADGSGLYVYVLDAPADK